MQIAAERLLLLTDPALKPLAGNLPEWPHEIPAAPGTYTVTMAPGGNPVDVRLVRTTLPGGYNLLVGRDQARFAPLEQRFWYGLAAAVAVLSVVGMFGGILIRHAVLLRMDSISRTVSGIIQGDLGHRLPANTGQDEFNTLSRTINRMLDQIEQLVHGVRNVSNAIAHDLRTPLAELRSRLEELSLTRPAPEETFAEIDGAVVDVDRVILIFNALLRLAEIDTGVRRSGFVEVDTDDLAAKAVEFYLPAAEQKEISLSFRGEAGWPIAGDPVLLAQAIANLIDNALKFTPEAGHIAVETHRRPDGAIAVTVADSGPGIADDEKAQGGRALLSRRCRPRHARGRARPQPGGRGRQAAWRRAVRAHRQSSRAARRGDHDPRRRRRPGPIRGGPARSPGLSRTGRQLDTEGAAR